MTERKAPGDVDVDRLDDFYETDGWFGYAPAEDPVEPPQSGDDLRIEDLSDHRPVDDADTDRIPVVSVVPPRDRQTGVPQQVTSPSASSWDFKVSGPRKRNRSKPVLAAVVAAVVAAVAVSAVMFVRRSTAAGGEEATSGSSTASSTAAPAPTSASPALSSEIPPPPPPPPPPPSPPPQPDAQVGSEPVITAPDPQPRQSAPVDHDGPEIGVTRPPMSATPPKVPRSGTNSGTPGDSPSRRGGWGPW